MAKDNRTPNRLRRERNTASQAINKVNRQAKREEQRWHLVQTELPASQIRPTGMEVKWGGRWRKVNSIGRAPIRDDLSNVIDQIRDAFDRNDYKAIDHGMAMTLERIAQSLASGSEGKISIDTGNAIIYANADDVMTIREKRW